MITTAGQIFANLCQYYKIALLDTIPVSQMNLQLPGQLINIIAGIDPMKTLYFTGKIIIKDLRN